MIPLLTKFAAECKEPTFFFLRPWYHYFIVKGYADTDALNNCVFRMPDIAQSPNGYWLIALGILDILLRLAGFLAAAMILYAGFQYITSNGEPDNARKAKDTIINAVIGMTLAIVAASLVNFVANRFLVG